MVEKRIYQGRFVKRVRINSRLDPNVYNLLDWLMKKYFPCRKKAISLILTKIIIEAYLREKKELNNAEREELQKILRSLDNICKD